MRTHHLLSLARLGLALLLCVCHVTPLRAQPRGPQGDTYASIAKLPDWSGIWVRPFADFAAENEQLRNWSGPDGPKLMPAAAAAQLASARRLIAGTPALANANRTRACPVGACNGMPAVMAFPFGIEFLATPGRVTILLEQGSLIRRVHTDGRAHAAHAEPSREGDSIGHWEGDTLVVDTAAIAPGNLIVPGVPTTAKTRVVERIRALDAQRLQVETVIEDTTVLREPWRRRRVYERSSLGWFDRTYTNDRSGADLEPDLTPPQ